MTQILAQNFEPLLYHGILSEANLKENIIFLKNKRINFLYAVSGVVLRLKLCSIKKINSMISIIHNCLYILDTATVALL